MTTPNFTSALDVPMDDIERPKPLPTGTYMAQIVGLPTNRDVTTKDGEKETVNVNIKLVAPQQIDNPDALPEYGDITAARPLQRTFWFNKPPTPEDLWAFKQFIANVLKIDMHGKTIKQVCTEMSGKQLLVTVGNNQYTDKNTGEPVIGSQITATAAL